MTPEYVVTVAQHALETTLLVSAPVLVTSLVVGLLISIFQTATQINEATLTFVPKIVAVFFVGILFSSWMLRVMIEFITTIFVNIPKYV